MEQILRNGGLLLLALLSSATASAYDFEVDGIYYNLVTAGDTPSVAVTYGDNKYQGDIIIPEKIQFRGRELKVKEIGYKAFSDCSGLKSIVIPNSVTSIGERAFYGCSGLASIEIPNSVTSFGGMFGRVFKGCSSLTNIEIPNSFTYIGDADFSGCSSLTNIVIPNSVTHIGDSAFSGCSSLTNIVIPNSVTKIRYSAFDGCPLEEIIFEKGDDILKLNYSSGECSFMDNTPSKVMIGRRIVGVNDGEKITPHVVPSSKWCDSLESLSIAVDNSEVKCNDGHGYEYETTFIALGALNSLRYLTFEENCQNVPINGLHICKNITEVYSKNVVPPSVSEFSNSVYVKATLYVPEEAIEAYKEAPMWKNFWVIESLPESRIEDIRVNSPENSEDVIYDLTGRRLKEPQKGLNIINGKKVLIN